MGEVKKGLILEGGALKGIFSCGVIDVLMENGIEFDGAIGISAGAVLGCNYKSKQIGRPLRYNLKYAKDKRYHSFWSLRKTGDIYGVDFCYRLLPNELDIFDTETYKNNPMKFYVGATNIDTAICEFHECPNGDELDMLWFRASASIPIVSKPVEIDGNKYLDGGIDNSIPFEYFESLGYNKNIIILTKPKGFRKKLIKHRILLKHFLKKMPKVRDKVLIRHLIYNKQMDDIDDRENKGISLVIRPPKKLKIGTMEKNRKRIQKVYDLGRKVALERLDEIKEFLNIK